MLEHHTLLELVKIAETLRNDWRDASLRARAGERARDIAIHVAERLAIVEALLRPIAAG